LNFGKFYSLASVLTACYMVLFSHCTMSTNYIILSIPKPFALFLIPFVLLGIVIQIRARRG